MPCGQTEAAASSLQYNERVCQSDFTPRHTDNTDCTVPQHLISSVDMYMQLSVWGRSLSATNGQCVVLTGVKILAICSKTTDTMLHQLQRLHSIRKAWLQHWYLDECHMMLLHTTVNKITKVTTHSDQIRGQWTQHTSVSIVATEDNQAVLLGRNMGMWLCGTP